MLYLLGMNDQRKGQTMTTATAPREDVHRIAVLDPAEYTLVATLDQHPDEGHFSIEVDGYVSAEAIFEALDGEVNICRVCGQNHGNRYWGFFRHDPTGAVIQVGSSCGSKVGLASREQLEQVRAYEGRRMTVERGEALTGQPSKVRALTWAERLCEHYRLTLRDDGVSLSLYPYTTRDRRGRVIEGDDPETALTQDAMFKLTFARDLLSRFNRYASAPSDRQVALVDKWVREAPARAAAEAQRAAEDEAAAPVPVTEDRIVVTGEIVSAKIVDNDFGCTTKIVVKADEGFKVWGSCPSDLDAPLADLKGQRVTFAARVEPSEDDPKFGFFKRPTKAAALS